MLIAIRSDLQLNVHHVLTALPLDRNNPETIVVVHPHSITAGFHVQ